VSKDGRLYIGISMPNKDEHRKVLDTLKKYSEENSRSLANQTYIIIKEYLQKEGLL